MPPTRGVYKGEAESELAVGVTVRKARAAISEPEFLRTAQAAPRSAQRRSQYSGLVYDQQRQQQQQQQQ